MDEFPENQTNSVKTIIKSLSQTPIYANLIQLLLLVFGVFGNFAIIFIIAINKELRDAKPHSHSKPLRAILVSVLAFGDLLQCVFYVNKPV